MRADLRGAVNLTRAVDLAVLAVLVLAHFHPETAAPIEVIWAAMGAGGSVYAAHAWWRRWAVDRWRQQAGFNGLFALTSRQHWVMRLLGLIVELLILVSGISAMLTPLSIRPEVRLDDLVTTVSVIGIAVASTSGAWYSEWIAERQSEWVQEHPGE